MGRGGRTVVFHRLGSMGPAIHNAGPLTKGSWWDGSLQDRIIWVVICRRRCWFFDSVCWPVRVRPPAARTRSLRGPIPPPPPVFPSSLPPPSLPCPLSPRFPSLFALSVRPSVADERSPARLNAKWALIGSPLPSFPRQIHEKDTGDFWKIFKEPRIWFFDSLLNRC